MKRAPEHDPGTELGAILVKMNVLTNEQLDIALHYKRAADDRVLGAIVQQLGLCSEADVVRAKAIQDEMRSGDAGGAAISFVDAMLDQFEATNRSILDLATRKLGGMPAPLVAKAG